MLLQALVRARIVRRALAARHDAATKLSAWYRTQREVARLRRARRGVVALQSLVRGRQARRQVLALRVELGRRQPPTKDEAATIIQVLEVYPV